MAAITKEMEAFLDYAEEHGFCLYQIMDDDSEYAGWEDCMWNPTHLREALRDYPEQPRAAKSYPGHIYPYDINNHLIWHIVDPNDVFLHFQTKALGALVEAKEQKELAEYFKKIWIEKTELLIGMDLQEID